MYFPVIRSKRYELLALRDLAKQIVEHGRIVPIIEPMNINGDLERAFDSFIQATMSFCLIANPEVGDLQNVPMSQTKADIFDALLPEYDNVVPTMYLRGETSVQQIDEFIELFPGQKAFFFLQDAVDAVVDAAVRADPVYAMFRRGGNVNAATVARFAVEKRVEIAESFTPADTNADYPDQEPFSTQHQTTPNESFAHFGDYTIIGRAIQEGWAPYCVVIHYVYIDNGHPGPLWIRHYKSDSNATQADPGGKYSEALQKLINDLPGLGAHNRTSATALYEREYANQHYPGLGTLKRRGIVHHVELVLTLI